jgi:hypothetical protein
MNQVFGYQVSVEDRFSNNIVFDGTKPVSMPSGFDRKLCQLNVFAHPESSLKTYVSEKNDSITYLLGIPAHPHITTSEIPKWSSRIVAAGHYKRFRELLGAFVVIVDEPAQHRITFVTDIMGLRPFFIGKHNDRIVFGTDVWTLYQAGLCNGTIDYDAVSEWIFYRYCLGDRSLFSSLTRLPFGTVSIFQDDKHAEISYTEFQPKSYTPPPQQVAEDLYAIVASTVKTLLADYPRVSIALSGGYDSRFLLALYSSLTKATIDCATVSFTKAEGSVAAQVADTLELPLKIFPEERSEWNYYNNVYHFTPNGFPISKFVTYCVAKEYPGIPMLNGFLGDVLMRGAIDKIQEKYETEWNENLADVLEHWHAPFSYKVFRKIIRKNISERIRMRSRPLIEKAVRKASNIGKVFNWAGIYYRQRHYISNNFVQHIGIAEALIPYYSWPLLSYKMEHEYKIFSRYIYQRIFQTHYPELAQIPYAKDLASNKKTFRAAQCTKRWAREMLPVICNKNYLSLLQKKTCIPLNMSGFTHLQKAQTAIFLFKRLYLLEKKVKEAGLDFDWNCI